MRPSPIRQSAVPRSLLRPRLVHILSTYKASPPRPCIDTLASSLRLFLSLFLFGLPGCAPGTSPPFLSFFQQVGRLVSGDSISFPSKFKMHFSISATLLVLASPLLVSAAPVKRTSGTDSADLVVLQFANVLEQLETQFYTQALSTFQASDFTSAGFTSSEIAIEQFTAILSDESTHVTIIQETIISLGSQPLTSCSFDFSSVLTDVTTMAATARLVENVGVSAYLGAAHLVTDPTILTAAASIMTVEARHQTMLNVLSGTGSAIPQAFDIFLSPSEVLAIAGGFISGCDLGITANPSLSITNTGSVGAGTLLTFSSPAMNGSSTDGMFCQMIAGGFPFSLSLPLSQCNVPANLTGPVAIFITSDNQPLNNNARDQATDKIVAGPTMAFIDNKPEMLGSLVRASSNGGSNSIESTATISPAQASAIINSAASTSAASVATSASSSNSTLSASGTESASAAAATASGSSSSNNAQIVAAPGGPNMYVGPSPDGATTVLGWSEVPAAQ
ncbi:hypothetical protein EW146_g1055 [Bondarzewia mesenterica]|uniref:Ferritin-like domain-containing protein n=1 Tax=Bondarzewia mesenterica TaxID=1095465 RepID=A0A4S4M557_9AGAM|nr:hypothetical protein EW146_g1055 [Bondarzewia mesenterica]